MGFFSFTQEIAMDLGTASLTFYKNTNKLIAICHHRSVRHALFKLANQVLKNGASKDTDHLYERCIRLLSKEF